MCSGHRRPGGAARGRRTVSETDRGKAARPPGCASQAYPNPGSTPVSNGGDYETWQMFLRQGQRAEPPAAVGSGVHRLRGGRAAGPGGRGQHCARTLGGTLNQSQGGMYIRGAMKIGWVAPVKPSHPYLENDPAPLFDLHYLRISPWLWFRHRILLPRPDLSWPIPDGQVE